MPPVGIRTLRNFSNGATVSPQVVSITFPTPPAAGNFITAAMHGFIGVGAVTVTFSDNRGNAWVTDVTRQEAVSIGHMCALGSALLTDVTAPYTVTATVSYAGAARQMYLVAYAKEWSGLFGDHAEQVAGVAPANPATTSIDTGALAAILQNNEVLWAVGAQDAVGAVTFTPNQAGSVPSSGWTVDWDSNDGSTAPGTVVSHLGQAASQPRHVWLSSQSRRGYAALAAYKPASISGQESVRVVGGEETRMTVGVFTVESGP